RLCRRGRIVAPLAAAKVRRPGMDRSAPVSGCGIRNKLKVVGIGATGGLKPPGSRSSFRILLVSPPRYATPGPATGTMSARDSTGKIHGDPCKMISLTRFFVSGLAEIALLRATTGTGWADEKAGRLDISFMDVEGGAAPLFIPPAGESLLI